MVGADGWGGSPPPYLWLGRFSSSISMVGAVLPLHIYGWGGSPPPYLWLGRFSSSISMVGAVLLLHIYGWGGSPPPYLWLGRFSPSISMVGAVLSLHIYGWGGSPPPYLWLGRLWSPISDHTTVTAANRTPQGLCSRGVIGSLCTPRLRPTSLIAAYWKRQSWSAAGDYQRPLARLEGVTCHPFSPRAQRKSFAEPWGWGLYEMKGLLGFGFRWLGRVGGGGVIPSLGHWKDKEWPSDQFFLETQTPTPNVRYLWGFRWLSTVSMSVSCAELRQASVKSPAKGVLCWDKSVIKVLLKVCCAETSQWSKSC